MLETKTVTNGPQPPRAVFWELGSVVTVEQKWSLEGVFPSRAVFKVAARHETRCEWVGVGAVSQPWIAKGERSGLLIHTAILAGGLSFGQMKSWRHFLNLRGSRTN
jgi:hypothetical protein